MIIVYSNMEIIVDFDMSNFSGLVRSKILFGVSLSENGRRGRGKVKRKV